MTHSHFLAGCAGGISGVLVGYPFDTIRVNLQTQKQYNTYHNSIDCLKKIVKYQGIQGLYKGVTSPFFGVALYKTLNFGVYGSIMSNFEHQKIYHSVFAGTIAGQISGLILVPVERMKILSQTNKFRNPIDVLRNVQFTNILRHGFVITMMRETSFGMSYFPTFHVCKKLFGYSGGNSSSDFIRLAGCGGLTGAISWTIAYPTDVIKSKIQSKTKHVSTMNVINEHYRKEGIRGFYKGWRVAVFRAFPTHATVLAVYQSVYNKLNRGQKV